MRSRWVAVLSATGMWLLALVPAAFADGAQAGENIGHILQGWGKALFIGIVGIAALSLLSNRHREDAMPFILKVVVIGGFIFAPLVVGGIIKDLWQAIA